MELCFSKVSREAEIGRLSPAEYLSKLISSFWLTWRSSVQDKNDSSGAEIKPSEREMFVRIKIWKDRLALLDGANEDI